MKRFYPLLFIFLLPAISACNSNKLEPATHAAKNNCPARSDKAAMYSLALSVIDKHDNDNIWNLAEIDTTDFAVSENYFTNTKTRNRLVLMNGRAGLSAGSAHRLLMLFACPDSFKLLWSGQVGNIHFGADIFDLTGDGIMEILETSGATWMGECTESFSIYNFEDGKHHTLFNAVSSSVLDCGGEDLGQLYKKGDTLETHFDCSRLRTGDKKYGVRQIRTIKIHNGGHTDEQILKNLKVTVDTTIITL
jgi:hypothetical protein